MSNRDPINHPDALTWPKSVTWRAGASPRPSEDDAGPRIEITHRFGADGEVHASGWVENMATAANVQLLRAWIFGELDERPTRGDIKEWVKTTLAELDRVDTLARERSAELARACEERDETLDALAAEREALDAAVAQLGDERDAARRERDDMAKDVAAMRSMLRAAHCERDRARHFECEHGVRVTVRPHGPGGVASNDVDV